MMIPNNYSNMFQAGWNRWLPIRFNLILLSFAISAKDIQTYTLDVWDIFWAVREKKKTQQVDR